MCSSKCLKNLADLPTGTGWTNSDCTAVTPGNHEVPRDEHSLMTLEALCYPPSRISLVGFRELSRLGYKKRAGITMLCSI